MNYQNLDKNMFLQTSVHRGYNTRKFIQKKKGFEQVHETGFTRTMKGNHHD
jgi:hypothetical protein